MAQVEALVAPTWLAAHLDDPGVKPVDGSWFLPPTDRDARAEFAAGHIPGAVYFDIDEVADTASGLPHTIPTVDHFAASVGALGISNNDHVVVYDALGIFTAPRVWWMFRVFGHERVSVLNGGLPRWQADGHPLTADRTPVSPTSFKAKFDPSTLTVLDDVRSVLESAAAQIVDVRPAGRFSGTDPEPRPGVRSGHIPGSTSLPFRELLTPDGSSFLPGDQLAGRIRAAGIDPERDVVTTCGSGVTACILSLGLFLTGHERWSVYDGSWSEWGGRKDTPVETSQA